MMEVSNDIAMIIAYMVFEKTPACKPRLATIMPTSPRGIMTTPTISADSPLTIKHPSHSRKVCLR